MIFVVLFVPDWKFAWIIPTSADVPYCIDWPLFVLDSEKFSRKWAEQRLSATTHVVVPDWIRSIYYFVALFVFSIMNVETIYAKKSFLGLAFPVELRNAEFL